MDEGWIVNRVGENVEMSLCLLGDGRARVFDCKGRKEGEDLCCWEI